MITLCWNYKAGRGPCRQVFTQVYTKVVNTYQVILHHLSLYHMSSPYIHLLSVRTYGISNQWLGPQSILMITSHKRWCLAKISPVIWRNINLFYTLLRTCYHQLLPLSIFLRVSSSFFSAPPPPRSRPCYVSVMRETSLEPENMLHTDPA